MRMMMLCLLVLCERAWADEPGDLPLPASPTARQQVYYSASLCWYQQDRRASLIEIARERKYAKMGGVIDLRNLHEQQEAVSRADRGSAAAKAALRKLRLAPLPCSEPLVGALARCLESRLSEGPVGYTPDYSGLEGGVSLPRVKVTKNGVKATETPLRPDATPVDVPVNPCHNPPLSTLLELE